MGNKITKAELLQHLTVDMDYVIRSTENDCETMRYKLINAARNIEDRTIANRILLIIYKFWAGYRGHHHIRFDHPFSHAMANNPSSFPIAEFPASRFASNKVNALSIDNTRSMMHNGIFTGNKK